MAKMIVYHGKHSTDYWDATTPELFAASALQILTENFNYGWYYKPDEPKPYTAELITAESVNALPDGPVKQAAISEHNRQRAQVDRYKRDLRDYNEALSWYNEAKRVVEEKDLSSTVLTNRRTGKVIREIPCAWKLLEQRSDYEYERVELETLHMPTIHKDLKILSGDDIT